MERRASDDLGGRLLRWVDASLITSEQAEAIRAFEEVPAEPRRVPLIAEALGYLGAALALAAGIVALGDSWQDLSDAARLGALGGAVVVLLVGGFLARGDEPAIQRLGSVLWLLSVLTSLWFFSTLFEDTLEVPNDAMRLAVGAAGVAYGGVLYAVRRKALQQLGLAAGSVVLAWGVGELVTDEKLFEFDVWIGPAIWLLGVAWLVLTKFEILLPEQTGYSIGAVVALLGPMFREEDQLLGAVLGIGTAVVLLAASVRLNEIVLLGLGAVGLFIHLVRAIGEAFADTIGMPLVLLASGVLLIAIALAAVRLKRFGKPRGAA